MARVSEAVVHPTAVLDGAVELAEGVSIGPNCVLTGPITVGRHTTLVGNAWLQGPLTIGEGNVIYPFAALGFAPQHAKFDPATPGTGLAIGERNTIREGAVIHRAMKDDRPTTIGNDNYFMSNSHVGHDCLIADRCTLVTGAALGGHVELEDRVTIGGNAAVHQFCRIGTGAMLSGGMGLSADLPPWFMLTGTNVVGSINLVGLRRNGFSREEIDTVHWVYRTLNRQERSLKAAVAVLHTRADDPIVKLYIDFIRAAERPIATARPKPNRGS